MGGEYLDYLGVLELGGQGNDRAVCLGPDAMIADGRVDMVGEIDGSGSRRQFYDIALWREDIDGILEQLPFYVLQEGA